MKQLEQIKIHEIKLNKHKESEMIKTQKLEIDSIKEKSLSL